MNDEARPSSTLKGRLADVYVPALVSGALEALANRLGNRATVDDPMHGRATTLSSLEPLVSQISSYFRDRGASYRHVYSTTGVDRDAAEGVLDMKVDGKTSTMPIVVMAERRKLREIELRIYYSAQSSNGRRPRPPFVTATQSVPVADLIGRVIEALRRSAVDDALQSFEEGARLIDPRSGVHEKRDGGMAKFFSDLGTLDLLLGVPADDGRACCLELTLVRETEPPIAAMFCFERGDSGLIRELRLYWD